MGNLPRARRQLAGRDDEITANYTAAVPVLLARRQLTAQAAYTAMGHGKRWYWLRMTGVRPWTMAELEAFCAAIGAPMAELHHEAAIQDRRRGPGDNAGYAGEYPDAAA
jgi:hypothetical protein